MAIIAEPPALKNGSGSPVTGTSPIVIPMLMKTWNVSRQAIPTAISDPKRPGCAGGHHQDPPHQHRVHDEDRCPADETELLADRREDEVGGLGRDETEARLASLKETSAEELS